MNERKILKKENIFCALLLILTITMGIMFIYINLVQYKLGLNADIAAEGLLAKVIWESKEWVPDEWYFSTESRLISVADCAAVFYGMTKSICLSMGVACIVAGTFIIGGAYYLCEELNFTPTQKLLFLLLLMVLPNNKDEIELLFIYAGHYAFHIGLYFFTLIIYLKMLKKKKISKAMASIVIMLHFVIGVQGVRGILMITGPLMAVEVLRCVYSFWKERKWEKTAIVYVLLLNVTGYLGGKLPMSIGQPLSRNIRKAPQKFIQNVLPDFLSTFDWKHIPVMEKVVYMLLLVVVIYMTINIIVKGIKKEKIEEENWIFMNFFVSVFLTMVALVFTTVVSSNRYFVVIYLTIAMGVTILMGRGNSIIKSCLIFMIAILFVGNCSRFYKPMLTDKSYEEHIYMQVGEYLMAEGYDYAYADFEVANTATVYNDGKIQISAVNSFTDMSICKWLTSKNWYVPNVPKESKTAYIVSDYRLPEMEEFLHEHQDEVEFKTKIDIYNIYGSDYNYSKLTD